MSLNRYLPHVLVLPEDDANKNVFNGFLLERSLDVRRIQILQSAGGWPKVLEKFEKVYIPAMRRYPQEFIVLVVDLDEVSNRMSYVRGKIPGDLMRRVFVFGARSNPEALKRDTQCSYEKLGSEIARHCREGAPAEASIWSHELLRHNFGELERARTLLKPILFEGVQAGPCF